MTKNKMNNTEKAIIEYGHWTVPTPDIVDTCFGLVGLAGGSGAKPHRAKAMTLRHSG